MTRRRIVLAALGVGFIAAIGWAFFQWLGHGHRIDGRLASNYPEGFDFSDPPCRPAPAPRAEEGVRLRYLGVSGLYVEWMGTAVLTAPFFSNHGLFRVGLGKAGWNDGAIRRGLEGLNLDNVWAVLVGHGHYDHLADLPPILRDRAARATIYASRTSVNMLSAFHVLRERMVALDDRLGEWIRLHDDKGNELPIRLMAIASGHADHVAGYHFAPGQISEIWQTWDDKRLREMREGLPLAYLIDLLGKESSVVFRIHYQDAASAAPLGFPPADLIERHPVDLAVLCMPSHWRAEDYPEGILQRTRARHVLATHYEDFFRSNEKPLRFVATLTDRRAEDFLERVSNAVLRHDQEPRGPQFGACGPTGPGWSMPLPGEWLHFRPQFSR